MSLSLKCRYLAQFSVAELTKNAAQMSLAAEQCPFMQHARRMLSTSSVVESAMAPPTATASKHELISAAMAMQQQQSQQPAEEEKAERRRAAKPHMKAPHPVPLGCTDTINCPFFKNSNIDLSKLIVMRSIETLRDLSEISETTTRTTTAVKRPLREHAKPPPDAKRVHKPASEAAAASNKENVAAAQTASAPAAFFDYEDFFAQKIAAKKTDGSYRYFKRVTRHAAKFPLIHEHTAPAAAAAADAAGTHAAVKEITIWCSNDYLGLGRHPAVQARVTDAVMRFGAGSGGTRNISGSTPLHDTLERRLARMHAKEAALLFTSCYVANDTTLFTMARMLPECHILSDAGNHASMIQGIRNSGMPKTVFRHNDLAHLEAELRKLPARIPKIVAFESVHSMDGSICELEAMCDVAHRYGAIAFIDEVHAVGLYGETGAGIGERDRCLHKMDIITGTLGKAFGNIGGYIAGSARFVDTMRSYGAGFIFTTSLPPSVAAGALAAIEISASDEGRALRALHQNNAALVKNKLLAAGLPVMDSPSHIVPVMVGDAKAAAEVCDRLIGEHGIYIQSINYPTVARGEERLRIVPNPHHTHTMIDKLVESVLDAWTRTGLALNATAAEPRSAMKE